MTAGPSTGMQASVLVLNRLYMAIQVMSVRRAFCLLFKDLAEVINVENGTYVSYDFQSWREASQFKARVEGPGEH
ncbi:MAG: HNH endonuclease, partial [Deltaproteobacteria bacterium]